MLTLKLPSKEETQISIEVGEGEPVVIDIFELAQIQSEVFSEIKARGIDTITTQLLAEGMQGRLEEDFGVSVGISGCIQIQAAMIDIQEEVKKKYSPSSDSPDSTDSSQNSEELPEKWEEKASD